MKHFMPPYCLSLLFVSQFSHFDYLITSSTSEALLNINNKKSLFKGRQIDTRLKPYYLHMNSMKLVIPLHSLYQSIHTKDESKRGTAFAFISGVN